MQVLLLAEQALSPTEPSLQAPGLCKPFLKSSEQAASPERLCPVEVIGRLIWIGSYRKGRDVSLFFIRKPPLTPPSHKVRALGSRIKEFSSGCHVSSQRQ